MATDPIAAPSASRTVMVGCKHPNGVVLNLDHYTVSGPNNRVQRHAGKMTVTLKGWSHPFNKPDPAEGTGGYVFTQVPADFWEQWIDGPGKDFPMIADKTILGPHRDARAQARDHATVPQMFARSDGTLRGMNGKIEAEAIKAD